MKGRHVCRRTKNKNKKQRADIAEETQWGGSVNDRSIEETGGSDNAKSRKVALLWKSAMARDEKPGNKVEMGTLSPGVAFTLDDDGRRISSFSLVEGNIYNKISASRRVRHESQRLPEDCVQRAI